MIDMLQDLVVLGAAAILSLVSAAELPPYPAELPPYRLPGDVIPHHYFLSLRTDLDEFVFNGEVSIEIECKKSTDTIKIHSKDLSMDYKNVTLKPLRNAKAIHVKEIHLENANDFLVIKLMESLADESKYLLHIAFKGKLIDGLAGYYRSSYMDPATNTKKWLAVTQFEATDARRAFPCFDEPAMKATFTIRLGHKGHLRSISNMPMASQSIEEGWVWDHYEKSVPMSTYLVAFMVSDFYFRESDPEPNKVLFRVWAQKDAIDQVEFARKYGPKFLNFYEDFFDIAYPLPKQDMVAIPDFSAGAMENWGMITYRESQLLVDENTTSVTAKYTIADTVAHELAHQWFGNLVTMEWWTDLWLNEGFATYVASLALDHQFPKWNSYNYEVANNFISVFSLDALQSSHPVSVPIGHPDEITQIFDTISYRKGSLLLHMMNSFLGKDVFKSGVSAYLKKFTYSNSEQDDLWASLTAAAKGTAVLPEGVTVKQVMDKWTLQTGYPVITVKRDGGSLTVSQKRFLAIRPKPYKKVDGCWWIPLSYSTANKTKDSLWLNCDQKELKIETGAGADDWVVLNNKASGIYRVNYDPHTWTLLADALQRPDHKIIKELNRVQLVLDAMALAQEGELDYTTALRVLKYIRKETAYLPWMAASSSLDELDRILWRTNKYVEFKEFSQSLLSDIYKKYSHLLYVPDGVEEVRHKILVTSLACHYEVADCSLKTVEMFKLWKISDINLIPKDLRGVVYCEGVKRGGEEEWEFIWQQYLSSNIATEKNTFLKALTCTRKEELIKRYLEWSIDGKSGIRRQDASWVFANIVRRTQVGYKIALNFLETNIQRIYNYLEPNVNDLGTYVEVLINRMVFSEEVDKMKKFLVEHNKQLEKAQLSVKQGLETAEQNLLWMATYYDRISFAT